MKRANNVGMVYKDWFKRSEKYYKNGNNRVSRSSQSGPCLSCKKGFTLVELIVVLVILAILAAVTTPIMLGLIDKSKDKERISNADAALKSAQAVITDIYNNCSNTLTPELRKKIRENAGSIDGDNTAFWIWNGQNLVDGKTAAIADNVASYTVARALYKEAGIYYYYNGKEWNRTDETDDDAAINSAKAKATSDMMLIWPGFTDSSKDVAYNGTNTQEGDSYIYQEGEVSSTVKTVTLISDQPQENDERFVAFNPVHEDGDSDKQPIYQVKMTFEVSGGSINSSNWDYGSKTITNGDSEDGDQYKISLHEYFDFTGWKLTSIDGNAATDEYAIFGGETSGGNDSGMAMGIESLKRYIFQKDGENFTFQATVKEQVISKNVTFKSCNNVLFPLGESGSVSVIFNQKKFHSDDITVDGWSAIGTALSSPDLKLWRFRGWLTTAANYTAGEDGLYALAADGDNYGFEAIKDIVFGSDEDEFSFTLAMKQEKTAVISNDSKNSPAIVFPNNSQSATVNYTQYMPEDIITDDWDSKVGQETAKKISSVILRTYDDKDLLSTGGVAIKIKNRNTDPIKNNITKLLFEGSFPLTVSLKGDQGIDYEKNESGETVKGTITKEGDTTLDVSMVKSMNFLAQGGQSYTMFYANFGVWGQSPISNNQSVLRFKRWPASEGEPDNLSEWTDITISESDWAYSNTSSLIQKDSGKKAYYKSLIDEFGDTKVYGYLDSTGTYYWYSTADEVYLNPCCAQMFCECQKITSIDLTDLNAEYVTNERYENATNTLDSVKIEHNGFFRFFYKCLKLESIEGLENFISTGVASRNYAEMFGSCSSLYMDIRAIGLANSTPVTTCANKADIVLDGMFYGCSSLKSINVSIAGDTNLGVHASRMFSGCQNIDTLSYSTKSGLKYISINSMFWNTGKNSVSDGFSVDLQNIDVSGLLSDGFKQAFGNSNANSINMVITNGVADNVPKKLVDCSQMFDYCKNLHTLNLKGFENIKITKAEKMFYVCWNLTDYSFLKQFDTSECTSMKYMFAHAGFESAAPGITLDLRTFDTAKVKDFESMFAQWDKANDSRPGMLHKIIVSNKFVITPNVITKNMYDWCQNIEGPNGTTYFIIQNRYDKDTADGKNGKLTAFRADGGPESDTPGYLEVVAYVEPYSPQD